MPWFCTGSSKKKKRSNSSKIRVGGVGKLDKEDGGGVSSDGRPVFAVVLQSFATSVHDELTVQRGQVVEVMYHDGDWSFVRNLDSGNGYIPKMYCLNMDKVKGDFNNSSSTLSHVTGPLPCPRVINIDTLQRSGSSVNSVEVHHVMNGVGVALSDGSYPMDTSNSRTSSSSQVIYEVPRSPNRGGHVVADSTSQPTPEVVQAEVAPSPQAPSLPPRSAYLPSPAEIQRQWAQTPGSSHHRPGFLPGCRQINPFTTSSQQQQQVGASTQSPVLQRSGSHRRFSIGGTPLAHSPGTAHPTGSHRASIAHTPGSAPPTGPGGRNGSNAGILQSRSLHMSLNLGNTGAHIRGHTQSDFSSYVARTPGSAGVPSYAPSPSSARVIGTPGVMTPRTRYAATPSGAPGGVDMGSQWGSAAADSTPHSASSSSSYHPRSTRYRRHSSDLLLDSAISEDSNTVTYSPPQTTTRQLWTQQQRLSPPCVTAIGPASPPRQRPSHLPVRRTLSMQEPLRQHMLSPGGGGRGGASYAMPPAQSVPIRRASSYQEAVLCEDERKFGVTASLRPSELVDSSFKLAWAGPHRRVSSEHMRSRANSSRSADGADFDHNSSNNSGDLDDVFLPDVAKRPSGIYRCRKTYQKKFKGEIDLRKDELVIVLDQGRGEWAWAITSNNTEGLIPKSVLVRYHSDLGVWGSWRRGPNKGGTDVETQTERGCHAPVRPDSGASCNNTDASYRSRDNDGASCRDVGVSCTDGDPSCKDAATSCDRDTDHRTPSSPLSPTLTPIPNSSVAIPTNPFRRKKSNSEPTDTRSCDTQPCPKEWFDTLDSVDAARVVSRIDSYLEPHPTTTSPLHREDDHTSPVLSADHVAASSPHEEVLSQEEVSPQGGTSPQKRVLPHKRVSPQKRASAPVSMIPVARPKMRKAASVTTPTSSSSPNPRPPQPVQSGTVHYHDRISGMGSVRFESDTRDFTSSHPPPGPRHMTKNACSMLTAIKDYSPPASSKNCLSLKEGDLLHLQPHMHYPKGWMWVWHTKRRSFGYVPKSYVAHTYNTPPRGRKREDSIEDAV